MKKESFVIILLITLFISGCSSKPIKGPYTDVSVYDLNKEYSEKYVCVYGNYSTSFEYSGISQVYLESSGLINFILSNPETTGVESKYGNVIACGLIEYSKFGYGHIGSYNYRLKTDILTSAPNEAPYNIIISILSDCQNIPGLKRKDICYWKFAVDDLDVNICDHINNHIIKNSCLLHIAVELKDDQICKQLDEELGVNSLGWGRSDVNWLLKDICLSYTIKEDLSEISYCNNIEDEGIKNGCIEKVAINTLNPEICFMLEDIHTFESGGPKQPLGKAMCLSEIAIKTREYSLCENSNQVINDYCYRKVAMTTNKLSLCENIIDPILKDTCE